MNAFFPTASRKVHFARPLALGGLAGLLTSLGYLGFVVVHVLATRRGLFAVLGGESIIINGVPHTNLPTYLSYITLGLSPLWGLLLAYIVPPIRRPAWWKFIPVVWISDALSLGLSAIFIYFFHWNVDWYFSLLPWIIFGLLFGLIIYDRISTYVFLIVCPMTYLVALFLSFVVFPTSAILYFMMDTNQMYDHFAVMNTIPYQLSFEAFSQMLVWIIHGALMGVVIYETDRRRARIVH